MPPTEHNPGNFIPRASDFKLRDEPTNTWCDCQHERKTLEEILAPDALQLARRSARDAQASRPSGLNTDGSGDIGAIRVRVEHAADSQHGDTEALDYAERTQADRAEDIAAFHSPEQES